MAVGLFGLISRERPLRAKDIFRTPHDWLMLFYICWIIYASPEPFQEFKDFQVHMVTYVVTVHALTNIARIEKLFAWWAFLLMTVASLAILSTMGFDPLDSAGVTQFRMKGRLVLNLSIYNNPNTLAHSIVPVLAMLYFLLVWKKVFAKALILLMGIPLYCIFLTQSKGSFLSGFSTLIAILTFGRPKMMQIIIVVAALSFGTGALYMLPRMTELKHSKGDAAIQGRVAALKFGMEAMNSSITGIGPGLFFHEFNKSRGYYKAAHNSYNQNGAELGRPGLWLFLALIYSCGRTLMSAKTSNVSEERVRRILFTTMAAYVVSSWMADFGYRVSFIVLVGATAAFHRIIAGVNDEIAQEVAKEEEEGVLSPFAKRKLPTAEEPTAEPVAQPAMSLPLLRPIPGVGAIPTRPSPPPAAPPEPVDNEKPDVETQPRSLRWRRFGIIDIAATFVFLKLVERFWIYLIKTM